MLHYMCSSKIFAAHCKKRLQMTDQPKVLLLTLELLEAAMSKCGTPLHVQIGSKEFMNVLVLLLNQKSLP